MLTFRLSDLQKLTGKQAPTVMMEPWKLTTILKIYGPGIKKLILESDYGSR